MRSTSLSFGDTGGGSLCAHSSGPRRLNGYVGLARSFDLDPASLMRSVGLQPAEVAAPDKWVSAAAVARLLDVSAAECGEPSFAIRLAEQRRLTTLGPLSVVLREEPDLRSALHLLMRYEHVYNEALRMRLDESEEIATIRLWFDFGEPVPGGQALALGVAALHGIIRECVGAALASACGLLAGARARGPDDAPQGLRPGTPVRARLHGVDLLRERPRRQERSVGPAHAALRATLPGFARVPADLELVRPREGDRRAHAALGEVLHGPGGQDTRHGSKDAPSTPRPRRRVLQLHPELDPGRAGASGTWRTSGTP